MTQSLRPYQQDNYDQIMGAFGAHRAVCYQVATGAGKSTLAAHFAREAVAAGKTLLAFAHRRELVSQLADRVGLFGVDRSLIEAGVAEGSNPSASVHISSIQTLSARARRGKSLPQVDYVIIDEAHHARADGYAELLREHYPNAKVLGLTATPRRLDGKGLNSLFQAMVCGPSTQQLVDWGFLVPPKIWVPHTPSMKGIRKQMGDYLSADLAQLMDRPKLVGDIAEQINKHCHDKRGIIFAVNRKHSEHIAEELSKSGVKCMHIDALTPADQRAKAFADLKSGEINAICNVGIAGEGVDIPCIDYVVMARPTASEVVYLQQAGRCMRIDPDNPGKVAIILDHAGNALKHGSPVDDREWSLDDVVRKKKAKKDVSPGIRSCPECYYIMDCGESVCPECGHIVVVRTRGSIPSSTDGELIEFDKKKEPKYAEKIRILARLCSWEQLVDSGYIELDFLDYINPLTPIKSSVVRYVHENSYGSKKKFPAKFRLTLIKWNGKKPILPNDLQPIVRNEKS